MKYLSTKAKSDPQDCLLSLLDSANSKTQLGKPQEWRNQHGWPPCPLLGAEAPATQKAEMIWGCDPTYSIFHPHGKSPEAGPYSPD